jgi:hypothetical protein
MNNLKQEPPTAHAHDDIQILSGTGTSTNKSTERNSTMADGSANVNANDVGLKSALLEVE